MKSLISGAALAAAASAFAGTTPSSKEPPVLEAPERKIFTWDLQERARWEIKDNVFDFNDAVDSINDDNWLLNRFRLGLTVKPADWVTFYAQGQDAREWFSKRPNIPGQNGAEGTDEFDLRQGYVEFSDYSKSPWGLRLGRQTLAFGDQRLVGPLEWTNLARSFDAGRVTYKGKGWSLDGFASTVVVAERDRFNESDLGNATGTGRDQVFSGLYFTTNALEFQTTDVYALGLHEDTATGDTDFVTLGTRWKSTAGRFGPWDYDTEFAVQTGELAGRDLATFAGHVGGGYTIADGILKGSRFGLEYNYATGDRNPTDDDTETFQNLFPTNHLFYGFMDTFAWQNMHEIACTWKATPLKNVTTRLDFHAFWLAETTDSWYRANGVTTVRPLNAAAEEASRFAGTELDFVVTWQATKHIALEAGYCRFFAGDYLADTGPSDDANFGYVQTTISL